MTKPVGDLYIPWFSQIDSSNAIFGEGDCVTARWERVLHAAVHFAASL